MNTDYRALLKQRLATLQPYPAGSFAGAGIVIPAGGPDLFTNACVLIHLLRNTHGCSLPIEVWHFGRAEMSPRMRHLLRELAVDTVDAEAVLAACPARIESGWQLKPYALMWSRFERVLMLDADQVPLRDPSEIFDWEGFRRTGALLWPDANDILAANPVWEACGLPPRPTPAVESGQLAIDKRRHWPALQTALHLNEHAERYYEFLYGDKDTYLLALLLTGESFTLIPHRPFADVPFCLHQRDMDGQPLFQHRTGAKWRYSGSQVELPGAALVDECRRALAALRAQWNGLVFTPPARGLRAREAESRLTGLGRLDFVRPGERAVALELLPDGDIGAGRAADRMNWHCEDVDDEVELIISDAFSPLWRFRQGAKGHWVAPAQSPEGVAYLAEPAARAANAPEHLRTLAANILAAAGFPSPAWIAQADDLGRALRLIAAVEPQIADIVAAVAERAGPLGPAQAEALAALVRDLRPEPRRERARPSWPVSGRYTTDPEIDI